MWVLCSGFDPCIARPCQNYSVCVFAGNVFQCHCAEGFGRQHCETSEGNTDATFQIPLTKTYKDWGFIFLVFVLIIVPFVPLRVRRIPKISLPERTVRAFLWWLRRKSQMFLRHRIQASGRRKAVHCRGCKHSRDQIKHWSICWEFAVKRGQIRRLHLLSVEYSCRRLPPRETGPEQTMVGQTRLVGANHCPKGECPWLRSRLQARREDEALDLSLSADYVLVQLHRHSHCGGVLTRPDWVITAVHCVTGK